MTEIYLLDDLNASMHFHAGAKVISADPKASAKLQARNIRYSILEDYYDEKSLWQNEKIFFDSQIDWFNSLDDFFISRISFCEKNRIKLATVNYLRIKYFVDMTIIYSKMLSGLIGSLPKNSHLKYVYNHEESIEFSIFKFVPQNRMHFRSILVEICKLNNIQLSCISLSPSLNCLPVVGRLSEQKSPRLKLLLRSIRNYFLYKKYKRLFKTTALPLQNYKACFLHAGSIDIDIPLKAFLRDGGMTYVQSGKTIYQESAFFSCPVFFLSGSVHYEVQSQLTQASFFFDKKNYFIEWISKYCGFDVQLICARYFKFFVSSELSEILFFAAEQINFFEQQQIDALIVRGNTDNHAVGALIAAQCSKRTKRVCIQHSGLGINKNIFPVFETCSYDYLWTRDELSEKYFKREQVELYPSDCKIYQSAHSAHESKASQKMRQLSRTKEQCILYLETRFPSHVRAFGNPTYPLTAYYEFQKSMIDFMLEQTTVRWIFKHAPRSDYQSPILEYIRRMKNSNIVVSSVHFTQCIDSCDKVFMDFFSTAFCESILAGKPTLCLGVEHFDWIPEMKSAFGESFRSFLNFEDARRHLLEFIGEPTTSSRFKPILPYKDESINKFLSEFFQSIRPVNNNGI